MRATSKRDHTPIDSGGTRLRLMDIKKWHCALVVTRASFFARPVFPFLQQSDLEEIPHTHTHIHRHTFLSLLIAFALLFLFPFVSLSWRYCFARYPQLYPLVGLICYPLALWEIQLDGRGRIRGRPGQTRAGAGPRQGAAGEPGTAAGWKEGTQNQRDTRRLLQLACVGGTPTVRCGRLAGWLVDMYFSVYLLGTLPTYPRAKFATYAFFTQALAQDQAQAPWILFLPVRIDCVLYGCVH
jgi:hypothetical protein